MSVLHVARWRHCLGRLFLEYVTGSAISNESEHFVTHEKEAKTEDVKEGRVFFPKTFFTVPVHRFCADRETMAGKRFCVRYTPIDRPPWKNKLDTIVVKGTGTVVKITQITAQVKPYNDRQWDDNIWQFLLLRQPVNFYAICNPIFTKFILRFHVDFTFVVCFFLANNSIIITRKTWRKRDPVY